MPKSDDDELSKKLTQMLVNIKTTEDAIDYVYSRYNKGQIDNRKAFGDVALKLTALNQTKDDIEKLAIDAGAVNAYFLMLYFDAQEAIKKANDALDTLIALPEKKTEKSEIEDKD